MTDWNASDVPPHRWPRAVRIALWLIWVILIGVGVLYVLVLFALTRTTIFDL